jgi:hypothetical protein
MDWDDTQLAEGPGRPYGLLMHPTMPPLAAALAVATWWPGGARGRSAAALPGRLHGRLRGRLQGGRGHRARPLHARLPHLRHHRHLRRRDDGGKACWASMSRHRPRARRRRLHGLGHPRRLRHHDQAAACRPRGGERRHRGAAGARWASPRTRKPLDGKWGYLAVAGPGGEPALVRERFGAPFTMVSPGVSSSPIPPAC